MQTTLTDTKTEAYSLLRRYAAWLITEIKTLWRNLLIASEGR